MPCEISRHRDLAHIPGCPMRVLSDDAYSRPRRVSGWGDDINPLFEIQEKPT
jgi:hypothetical protein